MDMQNIFMDKLTVLPQKQLELSGMERGRTVLNKNYSYIREKLEEAKLNVAISVGNAQFVDSAQRPNRPSSPNHKQDIIKGIIIGLGIGVLIALLIELLDKQRIMYTRLSLSDDPEAIEMKNRLMKSISVLGFPSGTDVNTIFDSMKKTIEKMQSFVD